MGGNVRNFRNGKANTNLIAKVVSLVSFSMELFFDFQKPLVAILVILEMVTSSAETISIAIRSLINVTMATILLVTQQEFAGRMDVGIRKNQYVKVCNVSHLKNPNTRKLTSLPKTVTKIFLKTFHNSTLALKWKSFVKKTLT